MEMFDLYDKYRQKLGMAISREEPLPDGVCRLVIHICIFNNEGKMLIQQRSPSKKTNPNIWDISIGGCVQAGETSQDAAARELGEELGLKHNFSSTIPFFTLNFDGGFDDYYLIEKDTDIINEISFTDNEVSQVKWASLEEILSMIDDKTFLPYQTQLIELMFNMYKRDYGAFQYNIFAKKKD